LKGELGAIKNIATGTLLAAALIFVALMVVSPAAAQQSQAQSWCYGNSTDVQTIAGCTLVIQSGRESLASAYFNRGIAYKNKSDFDRAIADYTQAIQLNPRDAKPHVNRGNAYSDKGDFDRAIADYNEAIQLDPKFAFAYLNRGLANLFNGALPKALADLNQASELDPKFAYAALWLDIANRRSNLPSRLPEAIKQIHDQMASAGDPSLSGSVDAGGRVCRRGRSRCDQEERASLRCQLLQRRTGEASRFAGAGADEVRTGGQPQDCESARPHNSTVGARPRRRGDRIRLAMSASGTKQTFQP
jgi:tetratricopeptide (TPR) repeat protein